MIQGFLVAVFTFYILHFKRLNEKFILFFYSSIEFNLQAYQMTFMFIQSFTFTIYTKIFFYLHTSFFRESSANLIIHFSRSLYSL
ncbi:unnamed protein product, partial [Heterobilharzia americana]